jgi:hypothetical protein
VPDSTFLVLSCLASEFFQALESPSYEALTTEALNTVLFMLAVTCVREVAYAVFHSRDLVESVERVKRGKGKVPEPRVDESDPEMELSYALEYRLFGGRLEFNGLPMNLRGSLGVI